MSVGERYASDEEQGILTGGIVSFLSNYKNHEIFVPNPVPDYITRNLLQICEYVEDLSRELDPRNQEHCVANARLLLEDYMDGGNRSLLAGSMALLDKHLAR